MPFLWHIRPTAAAEGVRHSTVDPSKVTSTPHVHHGLPFSNAVVRVATFVQPIGFKITDCGSCRKQTTAHRPPSLRRGHHQNMITILRDSTMAAPVAQTGAVDVLLGNTFADHDRRLIARRLATLNKNSQSRLRLRTLRVAKDTQHNTSNRVGEYDIYRSPVYQVQNYGSFHQRAGVHLFLYMHISCKAVLRIFCCDVFDWLYSTVLRTYEYICTFRLEYRSVFIASASLLGHVSLELGLGGEKNSSQLLFVLLYACSLLFPKTGKVLQFCEASATTGGPG
jgi:hypothetical protein